jgi:hypothetical protein
VFSVDTTGFLPFAITSTIHGFHPSGQPSAVQIHSR